MSKFKQGDIVTITSRRCENAIAMIENWRGGSVAPYVVRVLETTGESMYKVGELTYLSGRDMELKDMQGKKKVWCCHSGCGTTSFESKGTLQWECFRHSAAPFETVSNHISADEKIDLILDYLGLNMSIQPRKTILVKRDS